MKRFIVLAISLSFLLTTSLSAQPTTTTPADKGAAVTKGQASSVETKEKKNLKTVKKNKRGGKTGAPGLKTVVR
ncbi:MAG: hypothetical protein HPY65_12440 [Syntrophaceae bacterium]|nr:hypothetical protein [Syntrophaceae bacterium]